LKNGSKQPKAQALDDQIKDVDKQISQENPACDTPPNECIYLIKKNRHQKNIQDVGPVDVQKTHAHKEINII
jgi:hypothetical protein